MRFEFSLAITIPAKFRLVYVIDMFMFIPGIAGGPLD
jgi:hypothetical protein